MPPPVSMGNLRAQVRREGRIARTRSPPREFTNKTRYRVFLFGSRESRASPPPDPPIPRAISTTTQGAARTDRVHENQNHIVSGSAKVCRARGRACDMLTEKERGIDIALFCLMSFR